MQPRQQLDSADIEPHMIGDDLWRVGFRCGSLALVRLLSGLVEVQEATWSLDKGILFLVVRNLDKTNTLFRSGHLQATQLNGYEKSDQPLSITWPAGQVFKRGEN